MKLPYFTQVEQVKQLELLPSVWNMKKMKRHIVKTDSSLIFCNIDGETLILRPVGPVVQWIE